MIFRPFYTFESGCAAYLFGCPTKGFCTVVDPQERDLDAYLAFAAAKRMRITHVIDTHVHADHRSAGRALATLAGSRYCLHRSAAVGFSFEPLDDGQIITLGNTIVRVLHTPGHTPESLCLVVSDLRRGPEPWFVCTGDTLFAGAVGRPDLPGHARENALALYASLHDKLLHLPATLELFPAHFGASRCGAGLSGKPSSTIAFELCHNPLLLSARDAFVDAVTRVRAVPAEPVEMAATLRYNRGYAEEAAVPR
jgi:glyoxylase-like metal-dependent hydrolase (beta-lactamase superfamily II)